MELLILILQISTVFFKRTMYLEMDNYIYKETNEYKSKGSKGKIDYEKK